MKTLTSRENPLYKELKLFATNSQARRKAGRTLLDGVHLAQSYLAHVGMPAMCIVSQSAVNVSEIAPLLSRCEEGGARCIVMANNLYEGLSQVEHGVGITLVIDTPAAASPDAIMRPAVLIDNLQDPGNLGSILRSAAAAGIRDIFCSTGTVFAWSPKVLRAGMGAHFTLEIREQADLQQLMSTATVPILATSSHAAQTLYEADLRQPAAWLFGNEGKGVSSNLLEQATKRIAIPHEGAIESLNVAAAAAVCLFEQMRQRTCLSP